MQAQFPPPLPPWFLSRFLLESFTTNWKEWGNRAYHLSAAEILHVENSDQRHRRSGKIDFDTYTVGGSKVKPAVPLRKSKDIGINVAGDVKQGATA